MFWRAFFRRVCRVFGAYQFDTNLSFEGLIEPRFLPCDRNSPSTCFPIEWIDHPFAFRKIQPPQRPLVPSVYQMYGQTVLYQACTRVSYCLPIREICRLVQLVRWYVPKNQLVRDSLTPSLSRAIRPVCCVSKRL